MTTRQPAKQTRPTVTPHRTITHIRQHVHASGGFFRSK
jgi:hypothetical protein